jgi:hypothetical protein
MGGLCAHAHMCTRHHPAWLTSFSVPSTPATPPPLPTCAAEGHSAHGGQVDGVSLVVGEELQPHITDADEQQGPQGQEVACRGRS